jgi:endonuclease-3 related protein
MKGKTNYMDVYRILLDRYGDTKWWPADTRDEIVIGTILTQNTSWKNVEKSIDELRRIGSCSIESIASMPLHRLSAAIRSSGFYNQKSLRLSDISKRIISEFGGIGEMDRLDDGKLSEFFSSMKGVGQETLDSILLYVFNRPHFVVDKYTLRISERIGILDHPTVESVKREVMKDIGDDVPTLKNFHGALVYLAKDYCRTKPLCSGCPVRKICAFASGKTNLS